MLSKNTAVLLSVYLFQVAFPALAFSPQRLQGRKIQQRCTQIACAPSPSPPPRYNNNNGLQDLQQECINFMENHQAEQEALLKRDSKIYLIPVVVATLAFGLFPATSQAFHSTLSVLSFQQYTGELSDEIRPLINGPVTLTISILFGSLVSMTISTLYQRQTDIHCTGIATVNEARRIQYLAQGLPEPERSTVQNQVKVYSLQHLRSFFNGSLFDKERRNLDLNPMLLTLHAVEQTHGGSTYLGELYGSVNTLKDINVQLIAAIQKNFTPAHYANLLAQATALLMIYLWETDDASLVQAHAFELRAAWAILSSRSNDGPLWTSKAQSFVHTQC